MALSKKKRNIIFICAAAVAAVALGLTLLFVLLPSEPDRQAPPAFTAAEYTVRHGDAVKASGGVTYKIIGDAPSGVTVSSKGVFSIGEDARDGAQVLVGAVKNGKVVATAVCTVRVPTVKPVIAFENLSDYIINGESVVAASVPVYSIAYSLKTPVDGISIDGVTGVVRYGGLVEDGTEFTVVASAKGETAERTFKTSVGAHVKSDTDKAFVEYGKGGTLEITLDFGGDTAAEALGVKGVSVAGRMLGAEEWSYAEAERVVKVLPSAFSRLVMGESIMRVYTARNAVSVKITAAVFVRTAEDLANIKSSGADNSALSLHYVLANDIDLTQYLSRFSEGWTPIGIYHDVTDGTALRDAFSGTFDGNGHTISGLWMNRTDELAYNGGLFGFVTSSSTIINLNVKGAEETPLYAKSFSGTLVGVNNGVVRNCSSDVKLVQDGADKCGAFVGRNFGTVENCYSIGSINASGTKYGAFCGENTGVIKNCYAVGSVPFCGENLGEIIGNAVTSSNADALAQNGDFSAWTEWITEDGRLPVLPTAVTVEEEN